MSVDTFKPTTDSKISATPEAVRYICDQLQRRGARAMRLGVKESGCNGFMYTLNYVYEDHAARDVQFQLDEALAVLVDEQSLPLVLGTHMDLVTEGLNSVLKFHNARAASMCGCGSSFSVPAQGD